MSVTINVDVAIVGAGIAGCHLAQLLSRAGIPTALIDQCELDKAGPHWINAVPLWMFDESHLERPVGNELFDLNHRFIIRGPDENHRLIVDNLLTADVDMGLLGKRLKEAFLDGKENNFFQISINHAQFDQKTRLRFIAGHDHNGRQIQINAPLFVDASGLKACLRKKHPNAMHSWPAITLTDTCTAAQRTLEIKDRDGAKNFLEKNMALPKDIVADIGGVGGYSLFRTQIDQDMDRISILCGVRPLPATPSAYVLVEKFIKANSWIGSSIIDGRGIIPINAPYKKLFSEGLALLGDAACQVYAAHGSGIGVGLIAAKTLADAIIKAKHDGIDPGSAFSLKNYQKQFHRKMYARLYFSEQLRKFSQDLDHDQLIRLLKSGLLNQDLVRQTLMEEEMTLSTWESFFAGVIKSPMAFFSLVPMLCKIVIGKFYTALLQQSH